MVVESSQLLPEPQVDLKAQGLYVTQVLAHSELAQSFLCCLGTQSFSDVPGLFT